MQMTYSITHSGWMSRSIKDMLLIGQKIAKRYAVISTTIYLILFPLLLYFSLFSFMVFDNPRMTVPLGLTYISLFLSIPISIPISIFLVWLMYSRAEYYKVLIFCALPLMATASSFLLIELLGIVFA